MFSLIPVKHLNICSDWSQESSVAGEDVNLLGGSMPVVSEQQKSNTLSRGPQIEPCNLTDSR